MKTVLSGRAMRNSSESTSVPSSSHTKVSSDDTKRAWAAWGKNHSIKMSHSMIKHVKTFRWTKTGVFFSYLLLELLYGSSSDSFFDLSVPRTHSERALRGRPNPPRHWPERKRDWKWDWRLLSKTLKQICTSSYDWCTSSLLKPYTIVLCEEQNGIWYSLTIWTSSLAVLGIFNERISDAWTICSFCFYHWIISSKSLWSGSQVQLTHWSDNSSLEGEDYNVSLIA